MKPRRFFTLLFLLLALTMQACAPAAAPSPIAVEPRQPHQAPQAESRSSAGSIAPTAAAEEPWGVQPTLDNQFQDYGVNPETDT